MIAGPQTEGNTTEEGKRGVYQVENADIKPFTDVVVLPKGWGPAITGRYIPGVVINAPLNKNYCVYAVKQNRGPFRCLAVSHLSSPRRQVMLH